LLFYADNIPSEIIDLNADKIKMAKDCNYYARKLGRHSTIHAALQTIGTDNIDSDFLRRLTLILPEQEYRRKIFFDNITIDALTEFISHPPISSGIFDTMNELELLPMPNILSEKKIGLEKALADINTGGFDRENSLHLELEYSKYKIHGPPCPKNNKDVKSQKAPYDKSSSYLSFDQFSKLPWINGDVIIDEYTQDKIRSHVTEAISVYNYVIGNRRDAPVLIIGNQRYGVNFVVDPIKEYLTAQGVHVMEDRVSSFAFEGKNKKLGYIALDIWKFISTHNPDIFVVDGTAHYRECLDKEICTRFPGAMWGYLNDFVIYNILANGKELDDKFSINTKEYAEKLKRHNPSHPYEFNFFAPHISKRFCIGNFEYNQSQHVPAEAKIDCNRKSHIINSVSVDSGSYGYLDDHEEKIGYLTLGFNSKGLDYTTIAPDEKSFLKKAQGMMKEYIRNIL